MLRHNACGQIADPRLTCAHCGDEVTVQNVTPRPAAVSHEIEEPFPRS